MDDENGRQWFRITGYKAHVGTNKEYTIRIYIYEKGLLEALDRYKTIPGIKKKISSTKFPDVTPLTKAEQYVLEEEIKMSNITLEKAKDTWFFLR